MDTSETYKKSIVNPLTPMEDIEQVKWYEDPVYIKMCEKAVEIQELLKYDQWYKCIPATSFWFDRDYQPGIRIARQDWVVEYNNIWLPRQDQLQEMVPQTPNISLPILDVIMRFQEFAINLYATSPVNYLFFSMEQIWLAFVMKEKYNKIWNGEDWI